MLLSIFYLKNKCNYLEERIYIKVRKFGIIAIKICYKNKTNYKKMIIVLLVYKNKSLF